MKEMYFKIPYVMTGEFDSLTAYVKAKDEDEAKRKLIFHLSEDRDEPFNIEDVNFGFVEELKIIS